MPKKQTTRNTMMLQQHTQHSVVVVVVVAVYIHTLVHFSTESYEGCKQRDAAMC